MAAQIGRKCMIVGQYKSAYTAAPNGGDVRVPSSRMATLHDL
jgi:hypothetical protein